MQLRAMSLEGYKNPPGYTLKRNVHAKLEGTQDNPLLRP
ncbi:hypothetical protein NBRC103581_02495 [Gluconobacter wancherniae NBRC 103581]|nr:hypothetical protein NBRC103581_02495 [Gluconobacter wancherniae NBRC 103581]